MKNKWRYCAVTAFLAALLLGGCGDGSEGSAEEGSIDVLEPIPLASESEPVGGQEEGTPENTETPAPAGDALQGGGVPGGLSEEAEAAVLEAMKNLRQNLELAEYIGEAIHLVSSEEWFAAMAGGLYEGCRSYTVGGAGDATLSVQVGYDIEEKPYINVCYQANGQIIVLKQARGVTWLLQTSVSEGVYNGAFEKWQIDSGTGHMLKETGTYANGIIVGEYTKSERTGDPGEAFDLWTNRENFEYKTTNVTYNEQGEIAATPTPEPTPEPTPVPSEGDTDIDWSPDMM